uniref:Uncharacterized protein n=1 Tax=Picea sitchensis TaxID=3332 RepID=A0A6B9XX85_PICSI|nr:hypothetical protein Q903MT_gene6670 [Picea sitchensis]
MIGLKYASSLNACEIHWIDWTEICLLYAAGVDAFIGRSIVLRKDREVHRFQTLSNDGQRKGFERGIHRGCFNAHSVSQN